MVPSLTWTLRRAARAAESVLAHGGAVMHGPRAPAVAITFDDGPSEVLTPALLDVLAMRGARATFFMLGMHLERLPAIGRRVAGEQEIGCHSYAHVRETVQSRAAFDDDVARCQRLFERELGRSPRYFRFPWGERGRVAPRYVAERFGMTCVRWSGSGGDDCNDAATVARNIERALEPGAILLLHDGIAPGSVYTRSGSATVEALPRILDAIAARGFEAVSLGELLARRSR